MWFKVNKHIIFHILYISVALSWLLQSSSFWEATRAVIGRLSGALWLAEYLKRETECYAPHRIVMRCATKTIKPVINQAFVASSGEIITDYNDLYCLYHVCISDRRNTNNKRDSTPLKTHVWIVRSRNMFTGCESEAGTAPLYRNSLCIVSHSSRFRTQYTALHTLQYLCSVLEQCFKYNWTTDF